MVNEHRDGSVYGLQKTTFKDEEKARAAHFAGVNLARFRNWGSRLANQHYVLKKDTLYTETTQRLEYAI